MTGPEPMPTVLGVEVSEPRDQLVIRTHDVRVIDRDGLFVFEARAGSKWERQVGCDTLDEAVETAARHEVERRFRSAHARIPLTDQTALVFVRQRWRLETQKRDRTLSAQGRVVAERGKSWPNIYRALVAGTRGGLVNREAETLRGALFRIHVDAVRELREGAMATYPADPPCVASEVAENVLAPERVWETGGALGTGCEGGSA